MKKLLNIRYIRTIIYMAVILTVYSLEAQTSEYKPVALNLLVKGVNAELQAANKELNSVANSMTSVPLSGEKAHSLLNMLCSRLRYGFDCVAIDTSGKITAAEPHRNEEGESIAGQDHVKAVLTTRKPKLSKVFHSVEGINAVALMRPVFSQSGSLRGAVGILFDVRHMFEAIVKEKMTGLPISISVMQTDGMLVYDNDPDQIGRNAFSDPLYERFVDLKKLTKTISEQKSGKGSYNFYRENSDAVVKKEAFWDTVTLYGTEWRMILIHAMTEKPTASVTDRDAGKLDEAEKVFGGLATKSEFLKALENYDADAAISVFEGFIRKYPFIYSAQWVDQDGISRFGYPAENSLTNYDLNSSSLSGDKAIIAAVKNRKKIVIKTPLIEGDIGRFFLQPVFLEGHYLGCIYFITKL